MTQNPKTFDLEERLIKFAVTVITLSESLPNTKAGNHLGGQLIRSGTSPALNYGEAQSAESKSDFIHKLKIILKELRETLISIRIIERAALVEPPDNLRLALGESNQLVSIFVRSIQTASKNVKKMVHAG
jgi:four helix bundle protein